MIGVNHFVARLLVSSVQLPEHFRFSKFNCRSKVSEPRLGKHGIEWGSALAFFPPSNTVRRKGSHYITLLLLLLIRVRNSHTRGIWFKHKRLLVLWRMLMFHLWFAFVYF